MQVIDRPQTNRGDIREFFQNDACLKHYWPLNSKYGLADVVGNNHLIAADVITNGSFTGGGTGWGTTGAEWSFSGTEAVYVSTGIGHVLYQASKLVIGKRYRVTYTITAIGGGCQINPSAGTTGVGVLRNAVGTYTDVVTCVVNTNLYFYVTAVGNVTIDDVIVREVYSGDFRSNGCYFNGVSNCLQSTSTLSLSTFNKLTLLISWNAQVYDLTNQTMVIELGAAAGTTAGTFNMTTAGNVANDPLRIQARGDVNVNYADFYPATNNFTNAQKSIVAVFDYSKPAASEVMVYFDGYTKTPNVYSALGDNGANFINQYLYLGARTGSLFFHNGCIYSVAIIAGKTLTPREVHELYMWSNNLTNKSMITMMDY